MAQPENLDGGGFEEGGFAGRPTLATGEPVMARWFAVLLLVVVPVGLGVIVWAFLSFGSLAGHGSGTPPGW